MDGGSPQGSSRVSTYLLLLSLFNHTGVSSSATPWTAARQAPLSSALSQSLLKFICIESVILSNHLIFCHLLLLLPSVFPSIRVFSSELALHIRWPEYWSFNFSLSLSNEYSGLISFRIKWFNLFAVRWALRSLIQHHNSKASVLLHSVFFMVQLSHPYMTPGRTIAFTIWTFVSKVMSLLFNTLSRFVIAFLPRIRHLLISWLQSLSAVILKPKKIKSVTASIFFPSICHEVMGPHLSFLMLSFSSTFLLLSFTIIKRLFSSSSLSAIRVISST